MENVKDQVIKLINSLPDDVTVDDVMAELYFKLQIDAGLSELDEGKGIPHDVVKDRFSQWIKE